MAKYQKNMEEVDEFLSKVKNIISKGTNVLINNKLWS